MLLYMLLVDNCGAVIGICTAAPVVGIRIGAVRGIGDDDNVVGMRICCGVSVFTLIGVTNFVIVIVVVSDGRVVGIVDVADTDICTAVAGIAGDVYYMTLVDGTVGVQ